ncbi:MAG: DUF1015 domain-containing protein [Actinobacteria bacterium]|nr:DUF1015 domain-containing protein [Actinomycetota bacterium]MDA2961172.1 DUF1015 domain-containing protein [Actinomycetota bacterium]MDA2994134.1 DUF1015 domain-containing protein [Actinomycetota bacterium]
MPIFRPFRGLRFVSEHFAESVAPPYDVLSTDDVRKLRASASTNITWIDVPLPEDGDDPYQIAAETLTTWCRSGVLIRDDMQAFTIYRMSFADESGTQRTISGVIGALEVVPEGAGGVLPHERTTPKASTDRLELTIATNANLSPVWGLSRASGLSRLLETPGEHLGRVTVDGVTHTVERVSEPERVAEIEKLVSAADVLIADGHHRYGVARQFRSHVDQRELNLSTDASTTMVFVNEMSPEQLAIAAIHRLYTNVNANALRDTLLKSYASIASIPADKHVLEEMARSAAIALVTDSSEVELFVPRDDANLGDRDLDGARLEQAFASLDHTVAYQHGVEHVVKAVRSGEASAGILIRPVPFDEIVRTAERGDLMPPKSTFFTPKLLTGLVIRQMEQD